MQVIKLTAMVSDPNPALKSVHQFIKDSEKAAVEQRLAEAQLKNERPKTPPPPLKRYQFTFAQTGRPVGIIWEKRERFEQVRQSSAYDQRAR